MTKLSACGAELGSDCIFGVRLGFTGTPSDLIPDASTPERSMRPNPKENEKVAEVGSDARIISVLTDVRFVTRVRELQSLWSVDDLLTTIACASPPFDALIDTGAIVTGCAHLSSATQIACS